MRNKPIPPLAIRVRLKDFSPLMEALAHAAQIRATVIIEGATYRVEDNIWEENPEAHGGLAFDLIPVCIPLAGVTMADIEAVRAHE